MPPESHSPIRSPVVTVVAVLLSITIFFRSSDLLATLLYASKLAEALELTNRFDLVALLKTQNEFLQILSGQAERIQALPNQVLTRGELGSNNLRPRTLLLGLGRYLFLVASTDVSVIVPTLNEEKYLPRCLASLKAQSLRDRFEVIVVDGGSSDRTLEISHQYADQVLIEKGLPVGAARNLGAAMAQGDILAFIDADTIASTKWLEQIVKSFETNSEVVGVTGPTLPYEGSRMDELMYRVATGWAQRLSLRLGFPHVAGFNCAYRKDSFWNATGFDEERELSEDVMLSLRIRHQGRIVFDEEMIAYTSLRRIKKCGYPYLTIYYAINAAMMICFHRTLSYPKIR
jgi:GT2 family glycosyltransferase